MAFARERSDPIKNRAEVAALCRASVVLLSSHVEAYVKELGELALDSLHAKAVSRSGVSRQLFYHISKRHLDEIRETSDPEKIAEKVFAFMQSESGLWSTSGSFPSPLNADAFNKGFSNPAIKKIKAYFNRFGYDRYLLDLSGQLRSNYHTATTMIEHLVETRNKIAHGDVGATKTPAELALMLQWTQKFCAATDTVFARWWTRRYCSIR